MADETDREEMGEQEEREELDRLRSWREESADAGLKARELMLRDERYYHGKQLSDSEKAELAKRGQPEVVINLIAKRVNNLVGTEIDTRSDPTALPRTPEIHDDDAAVVADTLRYISDKGKFKTVTSDVARDQTTPGVGGCVIEVERKHDEVEVVFRQIRWDRLWWDPHSSDPLFKDAKYLGADVWMDYEDALEKYPDAKAVLEEAKTKSPAENSITDDKPRGAFWVDAKRNRLRVCECYYRRKGVAYLAHYVWSGFLLKPQPSPYLDEYDEPECPLEIVSGFVDDDNNRYGYVRNLVSPQDEVNKRRSKFLHQISVKQVIAEDGAVLEPDTFMNEIAKADGFALVRNGALRDGSIQINTGADMSAGQFQLLQQAQAEFSEVAPDSNQAPGANASGRAILAWQEFLARETKQLFDHLRQWKLNCQRQAWHRARQFWPAEMYMRVKDNDTAKGYRFVTLNKRSTRKARLQELLGKGVELEDAIRMVGLPDHEKTLQQAQAQVQMVLAMSGQNPQQMPPEQMQQASLQALLSLPQMAEPFTVNDLAKLDVDIVLDTAPDTAVLEQEEFQKLLDIYPASVQAGKPIPFEILIKASQLRAKREILESLKQPGPDPQALQQQQKQAALVLQQLEANVHKTHAQAQQAQASAARDQAEIQGVAPRAQLDQAKVAKTGAEIEQMRRPELTIIASPRAPM